MKPRIYHNPRCSKSRATLALLDARGIDAVVIEYLKTPPDAAALAGLLEKLGIPARDLVRKGERAFKSSGVDIETASESSLIELMTAHPVLIQRPIVETAGAARIGRPPEQVLELFSSAPSA